MIINEPSWVGREPLSHPLHRQEEKPGAPRSPRWQRHSPRRPSMYKVARAHVRTRWKAAEKSSLRRHGAHSFSAKYWVVTVSVFADGGDAPIKHASIRYRYLYWNSVLDSCAWKMADMTTLTPVVHISIWQISETCVSTPVKPVLGNQNTQLSLQV